MNDYEEAVKEAARTLQLVIDEKRRWHHAVARIRAEKAKLDSELAQCKLDVSNAIQASEEAQKELKKAHDLEFNVKEMDTL
jgi:hypothetical protein